MVFYYCLIYTGGIGIDPISSVILYESIAYGCSGIGAAMLTNELAATPIIIGGSEELKKKYLPRFIKDPIMAVSFKIELCYFNK